MRTLLLLFMILPSFALGQVVQDSSLQAELLLRLKEDQEVREIHVAQKLQRGLQPDSTDIKALHYVDSVNTAWIKEIIHRRGWPGISIVGPEGEDAAFLLVQHADLDTSFQAQCLQLLQKAYETGEATGQQVALLADRVAVASGHQQIYGTQMQIRDGHTIFHPIRDSVTVDERRARMGLIPLHRYKSIIDSLYAK